MKLAEIDAITTMIAEKLAAGQEQEAERLIAERLRLLKDAVPLSFNNAAEKSQWQDYLLKLHTETQLLLQKYLVERELLRKTLVNYNCVKRYVDEATLLTTN